MEIRSDILAWTPETEGTSFTLGRFDGVHLGHRALIKRTVSYARKHHLLPVCFSFREDTYPGVRDRGQLTTSNEKAKLLQELGIDVLLHPAFAPPLVDTPADEFLHLMLIERWRAKFICVGFDFRFGRDRSGDTQYLRSEAERMGVRAHILAPVTVKGELVKATSIRKLIADGEIKHANTLLGHPYSVTAQRVAGQARGRRLGFPTINLRWPEFKIQPLLGVYAVRVESDALSKLAPGREETKMSGVANFGIRPTVEPGNREPLLEVHLLDRGAETDGIAELRSDAPFIVEFHVFLRPEKRFDSIEALKTQIARDCDRARNILR